MSIKTTVELDGDTVHDIVRAGLVDVVDIAPDELQECIHRVISWYSVPGTYMNGEWDKDYD